MKTDIAIKTGMRITYAGKTPARIDRIRDRSHSSRTQFPPKAPLAAKEWGPGRFELDVVSWKWS